MGYKAFLPLQSDAEDTDLVKKLVSGHKVLAAAQDRGWAEDMAGLMLGWLRPVSLRPGEVVDELPLVPGVKAALKASLAADPTQRCSLDCFIQLMELGLREIEDLLVAAAQQEEAALAAVAEAKAAEEVAVMAAQAAVAAAEQRERVVREQAAAKVNELQAELAAAVAELQRLKQSSTSSSSRRQVEGLGLSQGDDGVVDLGRLKTVRLAGVGEEREETGMAPCTPTKLSDDGEGSSSSRCVEMMSNSATSSHPAAAAATLPAPSSALLRAAAARGKQEEGERKQKVVQVEEVVEGGKEGQEQQEQEEEQEGARGIDGLGKEAAAEVGVVEVGCKGLKLPRELWRACRVGVCAILGAVAAG
jgi:hypothetical protein